VLLAAQRMDKSALQALEAALRAPPDNRPLATMLLREYLASGEAAKALELFALRDLSAERNRRAPGPQRRARHRAQRRLDNRGSLQLGLAAALPPHAREGARERQAEPQVLGRRVRSTHLREY